MKKIVLGLALCLGLSQVAVAQPTVRGLTDDAKSILTWIKNNPIKTAAAVTAISYAVVVSVETAHALNAAKGTGATPAAASSTPSSEPKADDKTVATTDTKTGFLAALETGCLEAAKDFTFPAMRNWTAEKAVKGWKAVSENVKDHKALYGIPVGVAILIAALVIADMETTEEGSETRAAKILDKLVSSKKVVA